MLEVICVPVIVTLVFSIMEFYKKFIAKDNKILVSIIPIIAAIIGIVSGIVCFYAFPSIISASDIFTAILIGGASGLSATGCNQIFKQLKKYGVEIKEVEDGSTDVDNKNKS